MTAFSLRRARAADAGALAALKSVCFRETFLEDFAIPYPADEIARFENAAYSEAAVAAELADPRQASWVVEAPDGAFAGYARTGPAKLPHPDVGPQDGELYQLYMRRSAQGTGMGRALMEEALLWLQERHPGPLWLGVWSGNDKAQRFYARYGFHKAGEYEFPVGDEWRDREFILRRD